MSCVREVNLVFGKRSRDMTKRERGDLNRREEKRVKRNLV